MPRILHIGLGNFHRAHQAWYTALAGDDWRITGVVMGNEALFRAMRDGGGYALGIRGAGGLNVTRITLHDRLLLASRDAPGIVAAFLDPDLHIVTLTITEAGYCLSPATGTFDPDHPAIRADLAGGTPGAAIGLLVHGLARRAAAGLPPLSVLSCDNLSGNGGTLSAAVAAFAEAAGLATDPRNRFPDTMVDRITPATTPAIAAEISGAAGRAETAPVLTEAFTEWVIQDTFAGPRPAWDRAGAEIVADVAPYEMRKLRLLNAAHSHLAYAGIPAGHRYVHQAFADPGLRAAVDRLWSEAAATLPAAVAPSIPAYRVALADRFAVPEMRHELAQIARDGSLKLGQRLAPLIRAGHPAPQATAAIAAWIAFVLATFRRGDTLHDPGAVRIADLVQQAPDLPARCAALAALIGLHDAPRDWLDDLSGQVRRLTA